MLTKKFIKILLPRFLRRSRYFSKPFAQNQKTHRPQKQLWQFTILRNNHTVFKNTHSFLYWVTSVVNNPLKMFIFTKIHSKRRLWHKFLGLLKDNLVNPSTAQIETKFFIFFLLDFVCLSIFSTSVWPFLSCYVWQISKTKNEINIFNIDIRYRSL